MKQIIHVAQDAIRRNTKLGTNEPPIICRTYTGPTRAWELELVNPVTGEVVGMFVYRPHDPLPCGARLWMEAESTKLLVRPKQEDVAQAA